jgi:hypothetical protein
MRNHLVPHGQIGVIAKRLGVGRRVVARVAQARVRNWTGEAELVRRELIRLGWCPRGARPEDRRDRTNDPSF